MLKRSTLSHHILLERFQSIGIRGLPFKLFKSYLENREQCVRIGKTLSECRSVGCGVQQGTVLGPLFYLIYVNFLLRTLPQGSSICYADDTVLLFNDLSWDGVYKKAEKALKQVRIWLDDSLLTLNVEKSQFM